MPRQVLEPLSSPLVPLGLRARQRRQGLPQVAQFDALAYYYYAFVDTKDDQLDIYDGDTLGLVVDLGRDIWQGPEYHRLYGIDAPEIRPLATRAAGTAAREHLRSLIQEHALAFSDPHHRTWLLIRSHQTQRHNHYRKAPTRGKFGRWLVELFGYNGQELVNLNEQMLLDGFAKVYEE